MDTTSWIEWFLGCLGRTIDGVQETLSAILAKARFCDRTKDMTLNDRHRNVVNRLLDGFEGKLTTSKQAALATCSQDRAHRTSRNGSSMASWFRISGGGAAQAIHSLNRNNKSARLRKGLPPEGREPATGSGRSLEPGPALSRTRPLQLRRKTSAGLRRIDHVNPGLTKITIYKLLNRLPLKLISLAGLALRA